MRVDPSYVEWHPDPRDEEIDAQAEDLEFCEQCERVRGVTCLACGDEPDLAG